MATPKEHTKEEGDQRQQQVDLIFLGTGSSTGTPRIGCLTKGEVTCTVCSDSLKDGSKNRRRNPSMLIQFGGKNILIDCGKTFREGIVKAILQHKICHLDAVIITHAHADALLGLDDLREFTEHSTTALPVYTIQKDFDYISKAFPYLTDAANRIASGLFVPRLEFRIFDPAQPLNICGLRLTPLELDHGAPGSNSTCLGFKFGDILYMSDLNRVPDQARAILSRDTHPLELLIIDALHITKTYPTHMNLPQALEEIRRLRPKKTYLIGMSHDFDYDPMNANLRELHRSESLDIECSYDGLKQYLTIINYRRKTREAAATDFT